MIREYKTIHEIASPLMVVEHVEGVTYDELGEIELPNGDVRRCKVLEVEGSRAVVQLFESAQGINLAESKVRFLGHPQQLAVSEDMLGRVFNGMGQPIDGGPAILADAHMDINGLIAIAAREKIGRAKMADAKTFGDDYDAIIAEMKQQIEDVVAGGEEE